MNQIENRFLVPSYLAEFRCTGSLCGDTCCKSWKVVLDKKTYKNYKKISSRESKFPYHKYIEINKDSVNEADYGCVKINDDGYCPMLMENKLCQAHSSLGEEALSYTCFSYPRLVNKVFGLYEMCGTVSCPEIAKLVLLNEQPMEFMDVSLNNKRNYIPSIILGDDNDSDSNTKIAHHFWPLRIFTINTLQDRRYKLQERLVLLGLLYKKITQLAENAQLDKTVETIGHYNNLFNDVEAMKDILTTTMENKVFPFTEDFVKNLEGVHGEYLYTAANYLEILKNIHEALEIEKDNFSKFEENYAKAYQDYYIPYMQDKEYILENYLINEVFKEMYPIARTESIDVSYQMLFTLYNVVKFHLVGISAYYKKLDDNIVVNTIQAFSKAVLHHKSYLKIFIGE